MRFRTGLVVGKFYPPHAGHHALIDAAAAACDEVIVVVAPASHESVPLELRLAWLREAAAAERPVRRRLRRPPDRLRRPGRLGAARGGVPRGGRHRSGGRGVLRRAVRRRAGPAVPRGRGDRGPRPHRGVRTAVRADPVGHWDSARPRRPVLADPAGDRGRRRVDRHHHDGAGAGPAVPAARRRVGADPVGARVRPGADRGKLDGSGSPVRTPPSTRWSGTTTTSPGSRPPRTPARTRRPGTARRSCSATPTRWPPPSGRSATWGTAPPAVREQVRRPGLYLLTDDAGVPFVDDGLRDGERSARG